MFREVGKIFVRAFRMMFQYPIFIYLPAAYYFYSLVYYISKNHIPLGLLAFLGLIDLFIDFVFSFGTPIVFILIVLRANDAIDLRTIIGEARGYFWKSIGQTFAGMFLTLLYGLPFICLFLFIFTVDKAPFIASILWFWVIGFISVGPLTLGLRFLVDGGNGVFKNSMDGFRMLNGHLLFFMVLYSIETLISISSYAIRVFIGSIFTGMDFAAISFSSVQAYIKSASAFYQTPAVYVYDVIIGTILFSFYIIVATLAYIRCKNHASLSRAVRQTLPTDN